MQIIRAQPTDAPILSAIARAAKAHWGYPLSWLEQWHDQLTITPEFIVANETFAALLDGQIVAFHALLATSEALRLEHLWVRPAEMGQGIGRQLFQHAAARATALGASSLTIEADPQAEPFYRRMGAFRVGAITTEIDGQERELPLLAYDLTRSDCSRDR